MASIKGLIASTLGAYRSSHKSVPNNSGAISVANGTVYGVSYVPPSDGFIVLKGYASICHIQSDSEAIQTTSYATAESAWLAAWLRVRKGVKYDVYAHNSTNAFCAFVPDLGG